MNTRPLSALLTAVSFACLLMVAGCASPSSGGGVQCGTGQTACGTACVTTATDNANCGACGKACGTGQVCQNGTCSCGTGLLNCNNQCVASDATHCGSCSNMCASGQLCSGTTCGSSCPGGQIMCGTSCVPSTGDGTIAHCGGCNACPAGANACNNGVCGCAGAGQMLCGGACVDTNSSNTNCGSCGHACSGTCMNGTCMTSPQGGAGNNGTGGTGGSSAGTGGGSAGTGGSTTSHGGTTGSAGNGAGGTGGSGTGTGGSSTGTGGSGNGARPPGYFKTSDWNVSSVDWHGCVWTGIDSTVSGSTTSVTPKDFTTAPKDGGPYEVSGSVYNDYNAVALLGFNLNEATTGSNTQCVYNPTAATTNGPPAATIPSSATGIAVNWSLKTAPPTSFRIQLQSVDGATNANHRWCATITDPSGPSFIPFSSFYTQCWNVGTTMSPGTAFNKSSDTIDAVVFLVPGTVAQKAPFDFTITGFAPGTSKSDAPGGNSSCGTIAGNLGMGGPSMAASYQRAAVTGTDCKTYIIQNNNWGAATSTTQIINYTGTTFTVQSSSGTAQSGSVLVSFPSTYIGANGNIANGTYNTWADSGLPKQISSIQSAMTSFTWSGGGGNKDFNATYDVWFASSPPTAGSYNDGITGFLMVWLYKPSNRSPIGTVARTASIANHMWDVYVGPRGNTSTGTGPASRPVVSYVAKDSPVSSLSFDLKAFISDAVSHADTNNGVQGPFSNSWYLTDVFAGFEIWNGGDAAGLKSTNFSCVVK